MCKSKKTIRLAITTVILLTIAFVIRMIYEDLLDAMLSSFLIAIRNTIHVLLLLMWTISLYRRLVNKVVRRLMVAVGILLLFG